MPVGRTTGIRSRVTLVAMPDHVVATDPLELLSFVPELIGFEPANSLVLVTLRGTRTSGTLRVDLPGSDPGGSLECCAGPGKAVRAGETGAPQGEERLTEYVSALLGMACRIPGANGLVPVVFTNGSCAAGTPHKELFVRLRSAARTAGFTVCDELYVAADGWGRADRPPRARAELDAAWRLRRLDPDSAPVGAPPAEEATLPAVGSKLRERTEAAMAALSSDDRVPDPVWFAEYSAGWPAADIGPAAAALTAAVLARPWARDIVLFTWAWGRSAGLRASRFQERHLRGDPVLDEDFALALAGRGGIGRPRIKDVSHAIELVRQVAARLREGERGPCLASLAWLQWALGRGSIAAEYARAALSADPDHGFAQLVHTMLERGMLPEWCFEDGAPDAPSRRSGGDACGGMRL